MMWGWTNYDWVKATRGQRSKVNKDFWELQFFMQNYRIDTKLCYDLVSNSFWNSVIHAHVCRSNIKVKVKVREIHVHGIKGQRLIWQLQTWQRGQKFSEKTLTFKYFAQNLELPTVQLSVSNWQFNLQWKPSENSIQFKGIV